MQIIHINCTIFIDPVVFQGIIVPVLYTVLNITVKEKDLRLTISADMKVLEQCGIAAAKENQLFGLIRPNTNNN